MRYLTLAVLFCALSGCTSTQPETPSEPEATDSPRFDPWEGATANG